MRSWLVVALGCACSSTAPEPKPEATPATTTAPAKPPPKPLLSPKLASPDRPWGEPVPDAKTDLLVMRALSMLATGDAKAPTLTSDALMIGPALWAGLLQIDKDLGTLGTDSKAVVKVGAKTHELPMRSFIDDKARRQFLATEALKNLATLFTGGTPRAANDAERHLLYALVPFEIAGTPVTTIESPSGVLLLVVVQDGKLFWLDIPNMYTPDLTINVK